MLSYFGQPRVEILVDVARQPVRSSVGLRDKAGQVGQEDRLEGISADRIFEDRKPRKMLEKIIVSCIFLEINCSIFFRCNANVICGPTSHDRLYTSYRRSRRLYVT